MQPYEENKLCSYKRSWLFFFNSLLLNYSLSHAQFSLGFLKIIVNLFAYIAPISFLFFFL